MGKPLKQQIRGKGKPRYLAKSHRYKTEPKHRKYDDIEKTGVIKGEIIGFIDDPARNAIVARVLLENREIQDIIAVESLAIGDEVQFGVQGKLALGNSLPLYIIPDGFYICNIEQNPGDGGRFARSAGTYGLIISREGTKVSIRMPSKRIIEFDENCRAQIGLSAGGGIMEKPLLKAGSSFHKYKAKNKLWPLHRGVKMSAYDHPFGGKQHHKGKSSTVSRNAPPGRKVGHLAAKVTGRKEKKSKIQKTEGENR